jgi:rhodanese-related sulfurtransferase
MLTSGQLLSPLIIPNKSNLINYKTFYTMAKSAVELVSEAKQDIENLTPQQVAAELSAGNVTLIDIRESEEQKISGKINGSILAPRGMIEFYADPTLPSYKPAFDKDKRIILHCASGGRSALAVQTLKRMGYENIAHLNGGLKAWAEAGYPVEKE